MEAALRLSLHGVRLLGALRQSLLASLAVSLVIRVLKKAASFVLASLRASTYQELCASTSSFAAALLSALFEHPGRITVRQSR